jgi:hypothetical protein
MLSLLVPFNFKVLGIVMFLVKSELHKVLYLSIENS